MPSVELSEPARHVVGLIQQVNVLARELRVLVADGLLTFDVPPDCAVYLHDERVKLRLLQAHDVAHIDYVAHREGPTACSVRVGGQRATDAQRCASQFTG